MSASGSIEKAPYFGGTDALNAGKEGQMTRYIASLGPGTNPLLQKVPNGSNLELEENFPSKCNAL